MKPVQNEHKGKRLVGKYQYAYRRNTELLHWNVYCAIVVNSPRLEVDAATVIVIDVITEDSPGPNYVFLSRRTCIEDEIIENVVNANS